MVGIAGTFVVNAGIFERWKVYDNFLTDLSDLCGILQYRTNHVFTLDQAALANVHAKMVADEAAWLEHLLPEDTERLSHLKLAAIFIDAMTKFCPIKVGDGLPPSGVGSYQDGGSEQFDPPAQMPAHERRKFVDGETHMVAWLIGYHICQWFEINRTDRIDPYVSRTTDEFEIDLVSGLFSGKVSAQAMHLVLKALFLRD